MYRKGELFELTIALGSIAEKTGITCTMKRAICVGTCRINTAIVWAIIALVYV